MLGGVMTHAGASYDCDTPEALRRWPNRSGRGCVRAAERLRAAGLVLSRGECRFDAHRAGGERSARRDRGARRRVRLLRSRDGQHRRVPAEDIALSVLTTVIGHQAEKGWAIVDAGWMAMSRDRGTQTPETRLWLRPGVQRGRRTAGRLCPRWREPGARHPVARAASADREIAQRFPVGTQLRILPNHACATGAQFPALRSTGA